MVPQKTVGSALLGLLVLGCGPGPSDLDGSEGTETGSSGDSTGAVAGGSETGVGTGSETGIDPDGSDGSSDDGDTGGSGGTADTGDTTDTGSTDGTDGTDGTDDSSGDTGTMEVSLSLDASSIFVTEPGDVTLTATIEGPVEGASVDFYEDGVLVGSDETSPYEYERTFAEVDNGNHSFHATLTHDDGDPMMSESLVVGVAINLDCGATSLQCMDPACTGGCVQPSHVDDLGTLVALGGLEDTVLLGNLTADTETGTLGVFRGANLDPDVYEVVDGVGFVRQPQVGDEPPVAVWVFGALTVNNGITSFVGDAPAVLVSTTDLSVGPAAVLDVSAAGTEPGPGGDTGGIEATDGEGCGGGLGSPGSGGGAAFGTDGGNGAAFAISGGAAAACTPAYGDLVLLRGGSGGGGGEDSGSDLDVFGGGGGGALQLTALGAFAFEGIVDAGGGGARAPQGNWRSGSGGGAGGAIFLEGPAIDIADTAGLYANGGGGSSSSDCSEPGADGSADLLPAPGGPCIMDSDRSGGQGAAGSETATDGQGSGGGAGQAGGGGGGGLGRIVLNTLAGASPTIDTDELSPAEDNDAFRVLDGLALD